MNIYTVHFFLAEVPLFPDFSSVSDVKISLQGRVELSFEVTLV